VCCTDQLNPPAIMATQAQRNRTKLHILRDRVRSAKRAVKAQLPGASDRLKAHKAARLSYAETGKVAAK
jgi:hypothetical protein